MEIPRHWRLKAQRYRLEGFTCSSCGRRTFPPRLVCPYCYSQLSPATDARLAICAASIGLTDFESHIRPAVTESMPG